MLVLPSSSSGYVVFHATPCIPRIPQKNYIGRVPPKFSSPFPVFPHPSSGPPLASSRRRRSFAARRGATNSVSHEFREATRIGVDPLHIGRRFPTLRQYGQVPPVILRLFAPRRVAGVIRRHIHMPPSSRLDGISRQNPEVQKAAARYSTRCARFSHTSPPAKRSLVIVIFQDCWLIRRSKSVGFKN